MHCTECFSVHQFSTVGIFLVFLPWTKNAYWIEHSLSSVVGLYLGKNYFLFELCEKDDFLFVFTNHIGNLCMIYLYINSFSIHFLCILTANVRANTFKKKKRKKAFAFLLNWILSLKHFEVTKLDEKKCRTPSTVK